MVVPTNNCHETAAPSLIVRLRHSPGPGRLRLAGSSLLHKLVPCQGNSFRAGIQKLLLRVRRVLTWGHQEEPSDFSAFVLLPKQEVRVAAAFTFAAITLITGQ